MLCTKCQEEGKRSKIHSHGATTTTLMYCAPFYDENGNYHVHDRNTRTVSYSCSNGHQWVETKTGSCWCGWPEVKEKV